LVLLVAFIAIGGLFAATFLAWNDYRESAPEPVTSAVRPAPPPTSSVAAAAFRPPRRERPDLLVLTASRGPSWVAVRSNSESGDILYQGTLTQGERLRYRMERLAITLGLPTNVDATLAGKPLALPAGVATVLLRDGRLTDAG
jgi:hypothetical protein